MKAHPPILRGVLAAVLLAAATTTTHAALITWGAPTAIAGDTDVSTSGTLITALNFGPVGVLGTTINGVTFDPSPFSSGITTTTSQALSASYLTLLDSALLLPADTTLTAGFGGLTVGETYLFQAWVNNSGRNFSVFDRGDFPTTVSDTLGNSVDLYPGDNGIGVGQLDGNLPPAPGQYVIGTFTADSTVQNVQFRSEEIPGVLNGFQLRQLAPAAVPEPGTALAGLALVGLCGTMRRRSGRRA